MSDLTRVVGGRIVPMAGTWNIDPLHTSVGFAVRHLLTLVRGRFTEMSGVITIAEDPTESSVQVTIGAASVDFGAVPLDDAIRGEAFLNVENHADMTFNSTAVAPGEGPEWIVTGDLTIAGTTQSVALTTDFLGAVTSPLGDMKKMSFQSTARIQREAFGMTMTMEAPDAPGVFIVGNDIDLTLDVEADLAE